MFEFNGSPPNETDIADYLTLIEQAKSQIKGVHLYGFARESFQPEAIKISRLPAEWLENLGTRLRAIGLTVFVSH
jgi:hypothetical protein